MSSHEKDYVEVIYDENTRPLTEYPQLLANYLFHRYKIIKKDKLLDIGCGRGEFLRGFINAGVDGYAVDQSAISKKYCPEAELRVANIEDDGIPFPNNFFDVIYSKSVIEHFHKPENLVREMYRVLKPGGVAITLCPAWEYNYKIYYEDYSHRSPFMRDSLKDIQIIHGFENVQVEFFYQLPVIWKNKKLMKPLADLTRLLTPSFFKKNSKWVRFSKEIMLLSSATKPK
jgi:SAM-dependent methyltransferase